MYVFTTTRRGLQEASPLVTPAVTALTASIHPPTTFIEQSVTNDDTSTNPFSSLAAAMLFATVSAAVVIGPGHLDLLGRPSCGAGNTCCLDW